VPPAGEGLDDTGRMQAFVQEGRVHNQPSNRRGCPSEETRHRHGCTRRQRGCTQCRVYGSGDGARRRVSPVPLLHALGHHLLEHLFWAMLCHGVHASIAKALAASARARGFCSCSGGTATTRSSSPANEAQEPVLERFVGKSRYPKDGQRVVVWQRLMQAASDIFLGIWSPVGPAGVQPEQTLPCCPVHTMGPDDQPPR
jgi:hypothetical protein